MHLCELNIRGWRNYEELRFTAEPGVNLIVGDNAQGKTNLLEAIVYLGSGKSWRTQKSAELVRFGAAFADLEAKVYSQEREQTLRSVVFPGKRPRQLWRNGVKKKSAAECAGVLNTVLFCPEDLLVLKSGASARRKLADGALLVYQFLGFFLIRHGHDNALFPGLQTQPVQHTVGGGAPAVGRQHHRQREPFTDIRQNPQTTGVHDGQYVVHSLTPTVR